MNEKNHMKMNDIKNAVDKNELQAFIKRGKTGDHILLKDNITGETIQIGYVPRKVKWK